MEVDIGWSIMGSGWEAARRVAEPCAMPRERDMKVNGLTGFDMAKVLRPMEGTLSPVKVLISMKENGKKGTQHSTRHTTFNSTDHLCSD